ncbi:glycosyltransferase family 2 protein [Flavobacterium fluviale]|uniref:glycosyltransferase family 2 protein n=1 Tax=Flavobacterium fluviale TaxID=2249356 RepID=UPI001E3FCBA6|nr:glycosyltransferase family 2 protein [Flavobacterium fluviale]
MSIPKLSIITINYNNIDGLKRTVESVLNQSWRDFEYIIIDGGSTDGSDAYIESQSGNIDFWISETDKGVYNAMNKGIVKATGEYLLFLNSGDHFFNNEVLKQNYKYLGLRDIIYFNLQVSGENREFVKKYPNELSFSYFMKSTLPHPATFINASLFDKVGLYDESLRFVSDWKFFIESICKFNSSYIWIDTVLTKFYLDGLSSDFKNHDTISCEVESVLKSNFQAFILDSNELIELNELRKILSRIRNSRKIKILIKLGILKEF